MGQTIQQRQLKVFASIANRDAEAKNAIRTFNNAQLYLINSRSKGPNFDGSTEEYFDYVDACNLLHEGKMAAKAVISPLSPAYNEAI